MNLLFFDMEFSDGKVPGSIYSFGYIMTDGDFNIVVPPTDLLINPEASWNEYVKANILAYPPEKVEESPAFPAYYETIRKLFEAADMSVGFALNNDVRALRKDCERYHLPQISFCHYDMEKLCRLADDHRDVRGLGGCVAAWCGEEPENRHRSDGDAYATMLLFRAMCKAMHVTPDMMFEAYPECVGHTGDMRKKKRHGSNKKHRSRKDVQTAG